jgi:hypothetical protein
MRLVEILFPSTTTADDRWARKVCRDPSTPGPNVDDLPFEPSEHGLDFAAVIAAAGEVDESSVHYFCGDAVEFVFCQRDDRRQQRKAYRSGFRRVPLIQPIAPRRRPATTSGF